MTATSIFAVKVEILNVIELLPVAIYSFLKFLCPIVDTITANYIATFGIMFEDLSEKTGLFVYLA